MNDAEIIAAGGQPKGWSHTFNHPELGDMTFTVAKLPTGAQYLELAALQEVLAPGLTQGQGALLAESMAGIVTLMKRPVVKEERIEDSDSPGHEKLVQHLYDPIEDTRYEFPMLVWAVFMMWRNDLLSKDTQEKVKNSSGATTAPTSGSDIAAPSPNDSASLPSTNASAT